MRTDIPAPSNPQALNRENFVVTLFRDSNATPLALIQGGAATSGLSQINLTPLVKSLVQTDKGGTLTLTWLNQLTGAGSGASATANLSTPAGSGAAANCTLAGGAFTGVINAVIVAQAGANYTLTPTVSFANAPGDTTGSGAAGYAVLSGGQVSAIVLTSGGTLYTLPPAVTITPAGGDLTGSGATANAILYSTGGSVNTTINVTSGGTLYAFPPMVVFTNAGGDTTGKGAVATANVVGGVVVSVTLTQAGEQYQSPPTISFVASAAVASLTLTAGGSNYSGTIGLIFVNNVLDLTGQGAAGYATVVNGVVTALVLTDNGQNYTYPPTIIIESSNAPQVNQLVQLTVGGYVALNCIIGAVSRVTEQRGQREMTCDLITRDQMPNWRESMRTTNVYNIGVDINEFALDFMTNMGLDPAEYVLPDTGVPLVHDSTQVTGVTAWDGVKLVAQAANCDPWVNAIGQVTRISRLLTAPAQWNLTAAQVQTYTSGQARPPLTNMQVLWLDPNLSEIDQLAQIVGHSKLVCGFFSPYVKEDVYFSPDHTQRAKNTYLVVKQSINHGLLPVGPEFWTQKDDFHGNMICYCDGFIQGLAVASLAALIAASNIPDDVTVGGFIASEGITIPIGRPITQLANNVLMLSLMTLGQGVYEIWGTPYNIAYAVNTSEAYDEAAPAYVQKLESLRNDFVPNEAHAGALATNELIYRAKAAATGGLVVADDLRYEKGDIVACPNGLSFYVVTFKRDLNRGAKPVLTLGGFFF